MLSLRCVGLLAVLSIFCQTAFADCISVGTDFINNGGPYCINTTSSDYFSFGTEFFGCQPTDSQGDITPILIDPNSDEYFCSNVPTQPDGLEQISTCDVAGNELTKDEMFSGSWIVVIEGLTFAWMRAFQINAGPPVTVTNTPTATFTVTATPTTTATSTNVVVSVVTLIPVTVTLPSTTLTRTTTVTPRPITSTTTLVMTRTYVSRTFSKTIVTRTITTSCRTRLPAPDPTCTIRPSKASLLAARTSGRSNSSAQTGSTTSLQSGVNLYAKARERSLQKDKRWALEVRRGAELRGLLEARYADACSTTVLQTTQIVSSTITVTNPTLTVTSVTDVTSTTTSTPPPVTSYSGRAFTVTTITKATPTITRTAHRITSTTKTVTVVATIASTVFTTPTGVVCIDVRTII